MQITNVFAGHPDPAKLGKRAEPAENLPGEVPKPAASPASSPASSAALREIFSKYDVTNITPTQFSQFIERLHEAGAISAKDLQELQGVRADLEAAGIESDEAINLVEFYRERVQLLQRKTGDTDPVALQQLLAPAMNRLGWLEKFATARSHPDTVGMSALA